MMTNPRDAKIRNRGHRIDALERWQHAVLNPTSCSLRGLQVIKLGNKQLAFSTLVVLALVPSS